MTQTFLHILFPLLSIIGIIGAVRLTIFFLESDLHVFKAFAYYFCITSVGFGFGLYRDLAYIIQDVEPKNLISMLILKILFVIGILQLNYQLLWKRTLS